MANAKTFIYNDVLVPHERAVRKPLPGWIGEIRESLERGRKALACDLPGATTVLIACFNQAALMEVHFGRRHHAQELCTRALFWLEKLIAQTGNVECYKNGFQPFVNLARLDRINGSWSEALSKLNIVQNALNLRPVQLHNLAISGDVLSVILQDEDFLTTLRNMCTIDRLKTLLKAEMHSVILEWAAEGCGASSLSQFLTEAEAVALCCVGQYNPALRAIERWLHDSICTNRPVFLFRFAETLAAAGERETALKAALQLHGIFLRSAAKLGREPLTLLNRLMLLLRTSSLLLYLDAREESRELARLGYSASQVASDVAFTCEFLNFLKSAGVENVDAEEISSLVRRTKEQAWYGVAQANQSAFGKDHALRTLDELYQTLISFSEEMVMAAA